MGAERYQSKGAAHTVHAGAQWSAAGLQCSGVAAREGQSLALWPGGGKERSMHARGRRAGMGQKAPQAPCPRRHPPPPQAAKAHPPLDFGAQCGHGGRQGVQLELPQGARKLGGGTAGVQTIARHEWRSNSCCSPRLPAQQIWKLASELPCLPCSRSRSACWPAAERRRRPTACHTRPPAAASPAAGWLLPHCWAAAWWCPE